MTPGRGASGTRDEEEPRAGALSRWVRRAQKILRSRRRLARLNHILIPEKKPDRDRLRRRMRWRFLLPFFLLYGSLSQEGRGVLLLTMLVGLAGVDVTQTQVHSLFAALAGIMLASLTLRPFFRAKGLKIEIENAPRVSVGATQRFLVHLDHAGEHPLLALRVSGPFLPWDGQWARHPSGVASLRPRERATVVAEARFSARGEHHLDAFEIGALVPLGLALGPRRQSDGARFLVVPKIANVGDLDLAHRTPERQGGHLSSRAPGESDIVGVRPYRSGDALRHLHARTWARTGIPHVRTYAAEQTERIGVALAIDGEEATDEQKEAAISLAAGVVAALVRRGTGIDALIINDDAVRFESRTGQPALDAVLDRLGTHVLRDDDRDVGRAIEALGPELSSLVVISAHDGPAKAIRELRARGLPVRWLRVVDRLDQPHTRDGLDVIIPASTIDRGELVAP